MSPYTLWLKYFQVSQNPIFSSEKLNSYGEKKSLKSVPTPSYLFL